MDHTEIEVATDLLEEDLEEIIKTARLSQVPIAVILDKLEEAKDKLALEYQQDPDI